MKYICIGCIAMVSGFGAMAQLSSTHPPSQPANAATATVSTNKAAEGYSVIGYLEKQGRTITIKAGPQGPVYSVATRDGKVLLENVSAEQLKAQAPEIHQLIKTGYAGDARKRTFSGASPKKVEADAAIR